MADNANGPRNGLSRGRTKQQVLQDLAAKEQEQKEKQRREKEKLGYQRRRQRDPAAPEFAFESHEFLYYEVSIRIEPLNKLPREKVSRTFFEQLFWHSAMPKPSLAGITCLNLSPKITPTLEPHRQASNVCLTRQV